MSIDLQFLLHKNKTTIKNFILINKIRSYEDLKQYCNERNIIPITLDVYKANIEEKKVSNVKTKTAAPTTTKKKTTKRSTKSTRKASKSQS